MSRPMKDSGVPWIGNIPEEWEIRKGKFLLHPLNRPIREDDGVITCFRDGEVTLRSNRREEGFTVALKEMGYQGIEPGDLVVHGMDGFAGAIGVSDSRGKASPVLVVLDTEQDKRFLMYYLRSVAYKDIFSVLSTGIRARSCDLGWKKLANIPFLLPPLPEQRKIAVFLDDIVARIDGIRNEIQCEIERLGDYKKSLVSETICHGVRGTSRALKPSGIPWLGDVPTDWEIVRNKTFMKQTSEKVGERKSDFPLLSLSKQGVIVRDVSEGKGKFPKDFDTYLVVRPGNLVFCLFDMAETPRTVGLVKNVGMLTGAYTNFEIDENRVLPDFAYYYYLAVDDTKRLEPYYTGLRKVVKTNTFLSLLFPRPSISEQREIVTHLDKATAEIDETIRARKGQLEKLDVLKKTTIADYVTGRKEVPA